MSAIWFWFAKQLVEILVSLALFAVAIVVVMINAWLRDRLRYTSEAANTNFKLYSSLPDTDITEPTLSQSVLTAYNLIAAGSPPEGFTAGPVMEKFTWLICTQSQITGSALSRLERLDLGAIRSLPKRLLMPALRRITCAWGFRMARLKTTALFASGDSPAPKPRVLLSQVEKISPLSTNLRSVLHLTPYQVDFMHDETQNQGTR